MAHLFENFRNSFSEMLWKFACLFKDANVNVYKYQMFVSVSVIMIIFTLKSLNVFSPDCCDDCMPCFCMFLTGKRLLKSFSWTDISSMWLTVKGSGGVDVAESTNPLPTSWGNSHLVTFSFTFFFFLRFCLHKVKTAVHLEIKFSKKSFLHLLNLFFLLFPTTSQFSLFLSVSFVPFSPFFLFHYLHVSLAFFFLLFISFCISLLFLTLFYDDCDAKGLLLSQNGVLFRTCEDGAGWHLIPYRISPRSEFFSQAYKTWHITWGINLGPDWPPLARGSKFHTIHTPTRLLYFLP